MNKRLFRFISVVFGFIACFTVALAQEGSFSGYTPYSMYAIGDIMTPGSAYNKSMGGVGVATRNKKYINYLNPASITARDSLSFMVDFSLASNNTIFRQGDLKSANNRFNINNLNLSFPIYRSSAMMFGINPMSATGYSILSSIDTPALISEVTSISDLWAGQGSVSEAYAAAAVTFWDRLSIGVEGLLYFGNIEKTYNRYIGNTDYLGFTSGQNIRMTAPALKFGLQYEQPLGDNMVLGVGATYRTRGKMRGEITSYLDTLSTSDTLNLAKTDLAFASELGIGISLRSGEKWRLELNYLRSDWSKSGFDDVLGMKIGSKGGASFSATTRESFRAGFEFIPNENDIRYYYRRWAYRVGLYYEKSYFKFDGNQVNQYGLTFGVTLPVFRWSNGVTVAVDLGQRGSLANGMVMERYFNITAGFNAYDIWFQKSRYK